MRQLITLIRHEIRLLFISPPVYFAAVTFMLLMGFIYWAILRSLSIEPQDASATVQFFSLFWLPVFFLVPLLTMRSLAAERNNATLEALFSTPVPRIFIVLSKFLSAYFLYLALWGLTLFFPFIGESVLSDNLSSQSLLDFAELTGGLTFIAISGLLFVSIGIFTSSLTRSQLVAAMLAFTLLFIFCVGAQQLEYASYNYLSSDSFFYDSIQYVNVFRHLEDFSHGIIDTRPFILYLSATWLFLSLTLSNIESKS